VILIAVFRRVLADPTARPRPKEKPCRDSWENRRSFRAKRRFYQNRSDEGMSPNRFNALPPILCADAVA
jgi:hypothetical protein